MVNPGLLPQVVIPMAAMMVTAVVAALYFWSRKSPSRVEMELKDPFNLVPALKFGAFFAFILVVSKVASLYLGNAGIYATSIISGLADVDAITLSMATLGGTEISQKVAVDAIILAAISNEVAKTVISVLFGSREFKKYMVATSGAVMVVGLVIILC